MPVGHDARPESGRREHVATRLGALADIARAAWAGSEVDLLRQAAGSALRGARRRVGLDLALGPRARAGAHPPQPWAARARGAAGAGRRGLPGRHATSTCRRWSEELTGWSHERRRRQTPTTPTSQLLRALDKHCSVGAPIPLDGRIWGELFLSPDGRPAVLRRRRRRPRTRGGRADRCGTGDGRPSRQRRPDGAHRPADRARQPSRSRRGARHRAEPAPLRRSVDVSPDRLRPQRAQADQRRAGPRRRRPRTGPVRGHARRPRPRACRARSLPGSVVTSSASWSPDVDADMVVEAADELCRRVLRSPLEGVSCGVASHRRTTSARSRRPDGSSGSPTPRSTGPSGAAPRSRRGRTRAARRRRRLRVDQRPHRRRRAPDVPRSGPVRHRPAPAWRAGRCWTTRATARVEDRLILVAEQVSEQCPPAGVVAVRGRPRGGPRDAPSATRSTGPLPPRRGAHRPGSATSTASPTTRRPPTPCRATWWPCTAGDPDADPAELAMLDGMGASSLLMAGVTRPLRRRLAARDHR